MGSLTLKIGDIPDDIRLILKKGVQSSLVTQATKMYRSPRDLARILGVDYTTIYKWKKEGSFMKLKYLKRILSVLKIDLSKISKFVLGVKGEGWVKVIFKRRLPFEIPVELVAHLQGDGSVSKRDCRCSYKNSEPFLINSFIRSTLSIFETKIYTNVTEGKNVVELPAVIGKILFAKFGTFRSKEFTVPEIKDEEFMKRYVRAIFDDEGYVTNTMDSKAVSIELSNKNALTKIQKFLWNLGIDSHIWGERLAITHYSNVKLFAEKVGFSHPIQQKKLKNLLKSYSCVKKEMSKTKKRIIRLLRKTPRSTQELMKCLGRSRWTVQKHVYELIKRGKIYRTKKGKKVLFHLSD